MSDTPAANRRQVAQAETPDTIGAFPRLSDEQIAVLLVRGQRRTLTDGEVLIQPGEHPSSLYAVLEGHLLTADTELAADPRHSDESLAVEVHGRGRFVGDVGLLEGQPSFVFVSAIGAAEVVEVSVDELEAIVTSDPLLGEIILRAYLIRRSLAIGAGAGLRIVGSCFSPQTRDLLDFIARNRLPHRLVDLDEDEKAERLVRQLGATVADFPLVILGGSRTVLGATPARLAEELGMRPPAPPATCDVVVVGAGPAGLAAAVYAASDGLSVYLCDAVATGGQAGTSAKIENYLGFPAGISGTELADRSLLQVRKFGATLDIPTTVQEVVEDEDRFRVIFEDGSEVTSDVVVLATGVRYRSLPAAGLDRFQTSNLFYAATAQEARMCVDTPVAVVGGGNSAGQAALFLARTSSRVHLVVRAADLGAGMSRYLVDQIQHHPRINVLLSSEVVEAHGGNRLEAVTVRHGDVLEKLRVGHVFVFIGAAPATTGLKVDVARDPEGYILTGAEAELAGARTEGSPRFSLETTIPGVFAIGDVRHGSVKRMTSAVGEGASVVRQIHEYLNEGRHSRVCAGAPTSGTTDAASLPEPGSRGRTREPADPPVAHAGVAGEIRSTLRRMRWFRRMPVLHIAEERGEGPTVLLLHGIASSSVTFHHVIPLLERTHRCIAIDLLGFGESPAPEWADYTLADHVAAIERTVASLRLREPFTVVGHSMGALIGARYAARRQKRVAKLVMVSPPIYLAPHEIGDVIERARMDFYLRLYEYLRTNREFTLRHAALVQRLLPIPKAVDITEDNWEPFVKSLQHSIESQTTLSDIAHVKAPIDVIMGDLDEFRSEAVLRIVERMMGVTVRRVRATNHLIGKRLARVVAEAATA